MCLRTPCLKMVRPEESDMEILIIGIAVGLALVTIQRPVPTTLGIYGFLLPFDSVLLVGQLGPIHLHLTWIVAAVVCVVLFVAAMLNRGFLRPPRAALWAILLIVWAASSAAWAINPQEATFRLPVVALLLLLYLVTVSSYVTEKELATIRWMTIAGGCTAAVASLYQFSQGSYFAYDTPEGIDALEELALSGRAALVYAGRLTNPNTLAATLIMPMAFALGSSLSSKRATGRLLSLAATALLGVCILETLSRGAVVAAAVVLLVFLWRYRPDWRLSLTCLVFGGVVAAVIYAMPDLFLHRFSQTLEDRGAGRLDIWNAGLLAFQNHGIIGAGLDCFPAAMERYQYVLIHDFGGAARGPHNAFLGTAVELGIVGLGLLFLLIIEHFRTSAKAYRSEQSLAMRRRFVPYEAACCGLLVAGVFLDLVWEPYFWFAWTLLVLVVRARLASRFAAIYPAYARAASSPSSVAQPVPAHAFFANGAIRAPR
jgi:O-antigen ligase